MSRTSCPEAGREVIPAAARIVYLWRQAIEETGELPMMGMSIWKILIIAGIVMLIFGRGKVSELMGDVAKGIKSFKKGMAEDDDGPTVIDHQPAQTASTPAKEKPAA
jgi:sec-independent protein translocase protein TatA